MKRKCENKENDIKKKKTRKAYRKENNICFKRRKKGGEEGVAKINGAARGGASERSSI
jgi:hypothetical protein